ncbi:MAG: hypothetical protein AAFY42_14400 [Pseudomonadota bacterium]
MRRIVSQVINAVERGGARADVALIGLCLVCGVLAYAWASVPLTWISIVLGVFGAMRLRRRLPAAGNSETEHQVYKPW